MLALQISSMKSFMNHLLRLDTFDLFLLEEATISTACTYQIDGHLNKEFYTGALPEETSQEIPPYEFRPWSEVKGLCFDLIKGRRTPLYFRFVLHLMPEKATALLEKAGCETDPSLVKALVLNIRYDGSTAMLTTGTSYETFVLSKEPDNIWDKALAQYLDRREIAYEIL